MRKSGILLHISSLPSNYGIGTLGKAAFRYVDFLKQAGQKVWQVLPVNPTGYGDSPYQSFSSFAGNPYFIDLDKLRAEGFLEDAEYKKIKWNTDPLKVDYARLYQFRFSVLKKAYRRFSKTADYQKFTEKNEWWLSDYALFMALKEEKKGSWLSFSEPLRKREESALQEAKTRLSDEIGFWKFIQYEFYRQWFSLKRYANRQGIHILGDIPIYAAFDSVDVWAHPRLFSLNRNGKPSEVAGCPPDYYSKLGQRWGNPTYRWEEHKKENYAWWMSRLGWAVTIYDTVKIDHFRGFQGYYAIPAEKKTARKGEWKKGPGADFFDCLLKKLGNISVVAEDLGFITDDVRKLLSQTGYPSMKVLQFAFSTGVESQYLPYRYPQNCVCYTGTHDNDTLVGWLSSLSKEDLAYVMQYSRSATKEECADNLIAMAWASPADLAIAPIQDFLKLDTEARMNLPSSCMGNWQWRLQKGQLTPALAQEIKQLTKLYWR